MSLIKKLNIEIINVNNRTNRSWTKNKISVILLRANYGLQGGENGKNIYCYNVIQIFKFDKDNGNETDTLSTYYLEDEISMFSVAFKYKKGLNYLGTTKDNKKAIQEEQERFLNDLRRAKKIR